MLEAARWAPSQFNERPWAFAVATQEAPEFIERARLSLIEANAWARAAPVLIFVLSRKIYSTAYWFMPNRLHLFVTGKATTQMALQAVQDGLVFHQMHGFYGWHIRRLFQVPHQYALVTAIPVGYPGDIGRLPSYSQSAETAARVRHPHARFVFWNETLRRA